MATEQLKTKEVSLRDWMGSIVFSPEVSMTDHLAKDLAMQAALIEKLAYYFQLSVRVERVEAHRTGVNFIVTGNVDIEEEVEGDSEGEKERKRTIRQFWGGGMYDFFSDMTEIEGLDLDCFTTLVRFSGSDNKVRLGYSFPEPEREGLGKLGRGWDKARPLAGVLGRGVSGKPHVLDLAEEGYGQTLLMANDLKAVSEMTGLMLTSLRQHTSERQLKYAISEDTTLTLSDRLKARQLFSEGITTAKALAELLAIVVKRKGQDWQKVGGIQILAVIDLSRVDFSNREQRGNFTRLMSLDPQNFGVHLLLTGTARLDKEVLDNFVRPIIETMYVSGGYYNSTHRLEEDIDPFCQPFTNEWVRVTDGKETVFRPAKF